jgi:uracil-DNA glycosylase
MEIEEILSRNFSQISEEYKKFAIEKSKCQKCSVYDAYKQVVQSEGNAKNPTFMMIGEALGQAEVEQGKPFVGKAGQRLREELRKYKGVFNKNTTIITNVLPCRPLGNQFPSKNNGPHYFYADKVIGERDRHVDSNRCVCSAGDVIGFCKEKWLEKEIFILKPKVIVLLGAKALEHVRDETGITDCRGTWKYLHEYKAWSMATFHPSYILRCQNDDDRVDIVQDFINDIEKVATTWMTLPNKNYPAPILGSTLKKIKY